MPLSSGEDSDDGMNNLAMADFLDHIHSSDDEDSQPVTKPSKSVSKVETSKDVNCAEQRGNVAEPAHAANNNLPNKPNPVLRPFQAPQRSESSRVEEPTLITNAQCDGGEERDPVSTEIEDGEHAFGEIDLASIRAVYKEEAGNSQTLDDVLCSPEEYETRQLRENSLPVTKSEVGFGLDAFVLENVASETECCSLIKAVEDMGFSFWNPARYVVEKSAGQKGASGEDIGSERCRSSAGMMVDRAEKQQPLSWSMVQGIGGDVGGYWRESQHAFQPLWTRFGLLRCYAPATQRAEILTAAISRLTPMGTPSSTTTFGTDLGSVLLCAMRCQVLTSSMGLFRSMYSCLLYLNNCPEGGATR
eukprot:1250302-Rhodomonas_salina.4